MSSGLGRRLQACRKKTSIRCNHPACGNDISGMFNPILAICALRNPMHTLFRTLTATLLLAAAGLSQALETRPYTDAALAEAQAAGKPVAVHFHAEWCPTCKQQEKSLAALKAEPGLDLTVLVADYDQEKALKKRLGVRSQSVFVVFRGSKEVGRINGETKVEKIRDGLKVAL